MQDADGAGAGSTEAAFSPGDRVGRYTIVYLLEHGERAVVYRARDESLPRPVALTVIRPGSAGSESRRRFLAEARAIAQVDEPHILPVYEAGETADGLLYLAAKFVAGGDLGAIAAEEGPLAAGRVASIVAQVAAALDAAHARDMVHRDVKPASILLDREPGRGERAYLAGFGLAAITQGEPGQNASAPLQGTPAYMAPEQVQGLPLSERTDQYGLACTAFELLAGSVPYRHADPVATMQAQVHDPVPAAMSVRPDLPPAVDAVLARGMAKAQAARYRSCGEFAAALRKALAPGAGQPVSPAPAGAMRAPGGDYVAVLRRYRAWLIVAVAVLAAIVLTLVAAPGGKARHSPQPSATPTASTSTGGR